MPHTARQIERFFLFPAYNPGSRPRRRRERLARITIMRQASLSWLLVHHEIMPIASEQLLLGRTHSRVERVMG